MGRRLHHEQRRLTFFRFVDAPRQHQLLVVFACPVQGRGGRSEQLAQLAQLVFRRELTGAAAIEAEDADRAAEVRDRQKIAGAGPAAAGGDRHIFRVAGQVVDGQLFLLQVDL